ncbi:MAG: hypothetical protein EZS28_004936 [Streblomastix strix]|uniref:Uncharacterized protein n=1 Tax=Streblomastix strix TaxID=222440 RepID=A0A5J4WWV5_9EUKA|nr:MAG: hypothetical protein EZS28_004936 [Streblomastix strix]
MSNVYIDERLLNAAGLSDFPELYAYIKERYLKPIGELLQHVPIGDQTLQQQEKNNDDIIYASNEVFEPPVLNVITKLDLSSQLERQSFLASSGSDPQLIVYGDRITLTASYATTGLFPSRGQLGGQFSGYLFKSYPQEARPKAGDQVIALVGTDASNTAQYYILQNYESSKKKNYDDNSDRKIDILDTWNANGKGQFEAQSFGAKLAKLGANYEAQQTVNKLFSTISKKLLPPNTKYMPINVEQQEFSAMCLFKDIYDKSSAVQVAVSGQLNLFDCEFQGTFILDNQAKSTNTNQSAPEDVESHIDDVIIKHEKQLDSSPQPQYTITNIFNQFMINDFFPTSAYNTFYIVDDGTCRVCVFNLYFESKGLNGRTQEVDRISDYILSADGKSLGFPAAVRRELQRSSWQVLILR